MEISKAIDRRAFSIATSMLPARSRICFRFWFGSHGRRRLPLDALQVFVVSTTTPWHQCSSRPNRFRGNLESAWCLGFAKWQGHGCGCLMGNRRILAGYKHPHLSAVCRMQYHMFASKIHSSLQCVKPNCAFRQKSRDPPRGMAPIYPDASIGSNICLQLKSRKSSGR